MLSDQVTAVAADPPAVPGLPQRDRCLVMGILNVTPDSFSDGGTFYTDRDIEHGRAIAKGVELAAQGADIVDVGGESTRPGARRVTAEEELHRTIPVVRALAAAGVTVSIDTTRAQVAAAAVEAGAVLINDVSGGLADPAMAGFVATAQVPFVAMHWRAPSDRMHRHATYRNVVTDVVLELGARLAAITEAGVDPSRVVLDPGLGFAKTVQHSWALLADLDALHALGRPVLVGASRKSFLGLAIGVDGEPAPPSARDDATTAVSAIAAAAGAFCVRVHDVKSTMDAVRVAAAWRAAGAHGRAARPASLGHAAEAAHPWP